MICDDCGKRKSVRRYETETDLYYFCPECKARYESLIRIRTAQRNYLNVLKKEAAVIGNTI